MCKQGCTALLAKLHFRSEIKHFGTSLNRTCLCHTGTMQASILKSKLKQVMLGEDAKTSSLLEPVPIADTLVGTSSSQWTQLSKQHSVLPNTSSMCINQKKKKNCKADESKNNAQRKLESCNIFSEIGASRSKTGEGRHEKLYSVSALPVHKGGPAKGEFDCQSLAQMMQRWGNVHTCLSCQMDLKGFDALF